MSGIVGIWNTDGRPIDASVFDRMMDRLAHRGPDGQRRWMQGPVALGCQFLFITPESISDKQPIEGPSGAVMLFEGRLDDREDWLRELARFRKLPADCPDSEIVLTAYEALGRAFLPRLNGDFVLAVFDARDATMLLASDGVGTRPLHYCRVGSCFLFASEIKAILAHPEVIMKINEPMLANYLLLKQGIPGETFFAGIRELRPGYSLTVNRDGERIEKYWDFDMAKPTRFSSYNEYVEAFRFLFERAVHRRTRSAFPIAVAVGGVDSSSVFCTAEKLRRRSPELFPRLFGITFSTEDGTPSDEDRYIREIERHYGVNIERVSPYPPGVFEGSREEVWFGETPMVGNIWSSWLRMFHRIRAIDARVFLTGDFADHFLADEGYVIDLFRSFSWGQLCAVVETCRRESDNGKTLIYWWSWYLRFLARNEMEPLLPFLRRLARPRRAGLRHQACYAARIVADAHPNPPIRRLAGQTAHYRSLYGAARSSYQLLGLGWKNKVGSALGAELIHPFLDRDLLSFLLSVPGNIVRRKGAWKGILLDGMAGTLPEAVRLRNSKAEFTHIASEAVWRDRAAIVQCLRVGTATRLGYTLGSEIREEVRALSESRKHPSPNESRHILDLLGLETMLQVFVDPAG